MVSAEESEADPATPQGQEDAEGKGQANVGMVSPNPLNVKRELLHPLKEDATITACLVRHTRVFLENDVLHRFKHPIAVRGQGNLRPRQSMQNSVVKYEILLSPAPPLAAGATVRSDGRHSTLVTMKSIKR